MHLPGSRTLKKLVQDYIRLKILERDLKVNHWVFSDFRISLILGESPEWEARYLPVPIKGISVLDIGAGEGESAKFFIEHGAEKVICIEPDKNSFDYLLKNSHEHPQIIPVYKKFELDDLHSIEYDFIKVDIEGYEEALLDTVLPRPAVIEVHGLQLRDRFLQQGYRIENFALHPEFTSIFFAYYKC